MDIFVARQPIFNTQSQVVAYELLFRNSELNQAEYVDDNQATKEVLVNVFLQMGIDTITEGKKAFVNFSASLLQQQVPQLLPPDVLAVEILETVSPTQEVIDACVQLKKDGYWLVLDDFIPSPEWLPLASMADIIKVDFRDAKSLQTKSFLYRHGIYHPRFLAEKIETKDEFLQARTQGYTYFQGYFFSKPTVLSQKEIPIVSAHHLYLSRELHARIVNVHRFEAIVKRDMALSYQLLKYANSAFFGFHSPVHSIRHAAALLGQRELSKWIALVTLRSLSSEQPPELLHLAVIRGRHCELLAEHLSTSMPPDYFFFTGLFSLLDAFLGRPLKNILSYLPIPDDVCQALLGHPNTLRQLLDLVIAYEKGDWPQVLQYSRQLQLPSSQLAPKYLSAISWEKDFFRE